MDSDTIPQSEGASSCEHITQTLSIHEQRIIDLLKGEKSKYHLDPSASSRVRFLDTFEYTEALRPELTIAASAGGTFSQEIFDEKLRNITGKRTRDGVIAVHTKEWDGGEWRNRTAEELQETSDHEKTHGMLKPFVRKADNYEFRQSGCKEETYLEGKKIKTKGHILYESQTQLLTLYGAHPDARSFSELLKYDKGNSNAALNMLALANLLDLAFPDFQGGVEFLADQYFSCDQNFLNNVFTNIESYHEKQIPKELKDVIVENGNNSFDFRKHSIEFSENIMELRDVVVPENPVEALGNMMRELKGQTAPPTSEQMEKLRKIAEDMQSSSDPHE